MVTKFHLRNAASLQTIHSLCNHPTATWASPYLLTTASNSTRYVISQNIHPSPNSSSASENHHLDLKICRPVTLQCTFYKLCVIVVCMYLTNIYPNKMKSCKSIFCKSIYSEAKACSKVFGTFQVAFSYFLSVAVAKTVGFLFVWFGLGFFFS